jgi:hypothetical protein
MWLAQNIQTFQMLYYLINKILAKRRPGKMFFAFAWIPLKKHGSSPAY